METKPQASFEQRFAGLIAFALGEGYGAEEEIISLLKRDGFFSEELKALYVESLLRPCNDSSYSPPWRALARAEGLR